MKISAFEISLQSGNISDTKETNITKYKAPEQTKPKGREYNAKIRSVFKQWIGPQLEANEYKAYDKALTDQDILALLLKKYKDWTIRKRFHSGKETVGSLRTLYNKQVLYAAQPKTYLVSFPYNKYNHITSTGAPFARQLSFEECYRKCIDYKVADPRFVPPEYIAELRNRQNSEDPQWKDWRVPNEKWIRSFETRIGREAYNSVHFTPGWTREDTPIDSDI